jgi:hypothetical protein
MPMKKKPAVGQEFLEGKSVWSLNALIEAFR